MGLNYITINTINKGNNKANFYRLSLGFIKKLKIPH